jgi:hypothetical protein
MSTPVASNYILNLRAGTLRTLLNSGCTLRIFSNNITPTPANVIGDFTQATYGGYAGQVLTNDFAAQVKVKDGEYSITSTVHTFAYTSGATQTVYGWYIDDGTGVMFSAAFPAAIAMGTGVSFTLQIVPLILDSTTTP